MALSTFDLGDVKRRMQGAINDARYRTFDPALGAPGYHVAGLAFADGERLAGDDRYATSAAVAQEYGSADLVFLAMGFTGAQREGLVDELGVEVDGRGNVVRDAQFMSTLPGVFVAGDIGRGQSLIVWAIAEGRAAAGAADAWLTGASALPRPVEPTAAALR